MDVTPHHNTFNVLYISSKSLKPNQLRLPRTNLFSTSFESVKMCEFGIITPPTPHITVILTITKRAITQLIKASESRKPPRYGRCEP